MDELVLPEFRMDCQDWLVIRPAEAGLPDEVAGTPLLAVLSTAVLGTEVVGTAQSGTAPSGTAQSGTGCSAPFVPVSGVLTVGLLDDGVPPCRPVGPGCVAGELLDGGEAGDSGGDLVARYLVPAPDRRLALLAEFSFSEGRDSAALARVEALMASFRWEP